MITKNVEKYCKEFWNIENYEQAVNDSQMWELHHRLEVSEDGLHTVHTGDELMELGLIFDRPSNELIFLTISEHRKLHNNTLEVRKKIKEHHADVCGANNGRYGKPTKTYKYVDPKGHFHYMCKSNATKWHPDWKIIE